MLPTPRLAPRPAAWLGCLGLGVAGWKVVAVDVDGLFDLGLGKATWPKASSHLSPSQQRVSGGASCFREALSLGDPGPCSALTLFWGSSYTVVSFFQGPVRMLPVLSAP